MTAKKENEDLIKTFREGTDKVIKAGVEFTKTASEKIDRTSRRELEKAKVNPTLSKLRLKTEEATKIGYEKGKEIQKKTPSVLKKIGPKSLSGFEKFIGTIRRGTQYGKTSIEMLEQFAKMKELGIITEKEYQAKKKEILERI